MKSMFSVRALLLAVAVLLMSVPAMAAPAVSYNVSGSSNNWTLDFSVTNTLGDGNEIYFFGVQLPARNITASPTGWNPDIWPSWDNTGYGGSSIVYNNVWIRSGSQYAILNGQTLSGFEVLVASTAAPTSVPWFAYSTGDYTGNDYFHSRGNPGFEGTAGAGNAVPLPGALLLLGPGLVGLVGIKRRFIK